MKLKAHGRRPLAKGQIWKMQAADIEIVALGKELIHYRITRQFGLKRVSAQISGIEAMANYLETNEARLASISTVMEWTNAKAVSEDQAKSITSFLLPNQGMGTGWLANPEATRNGLWARLSKVTWTRASSMVTVAETSRRLRKSFLA